jgi:UDP-glucose 4-epimerase
VQVLITGSSGFVGRHLAAELARCGHGGICVARRPILTPAGWTSARREDVLTGANPRLTHWPDCVLHLEVKQHVASPSAADIAEFTTVNVDGTQAWLDWAARHRVPRFVYFSTIKAVRPSPDGPTFESAAGPGLTPYGASKWAAEERVRGWAAGDPSRSCLIVRPAVIYGPGNEGNMAAMVSAIRRGRFFLVGAGNNIKSLVSVRNVAAAIAHLIDRMQAGVVQTYNLVDWESRNVRELDGIIRGLLGRRGNSATLPPGVASALARSGDLFVRLGVRSFPLTSSRLAALLETTNFSGDRLVESGFAHPETTLQGLTEMVKSVTREREAKVRA